MWARSFGTNGKQFRASLREQFSNFLLGFLEVLCCFNNRVTLDQNIFAAEFILRIASFRCISVRLNAVMEIENLGGITKRSVDLFFCPDIECAFLCLDMGAVGVRGYNRAV